VLAVCDVDTTRREHHRKIADEFYSIKQDKEYKGCAEYKEFHELLRAQGHRRSGDRGAGSLARFHRD